VLLDAAERAGMEYHYARRMGVRPREHVDPETGALTWAHSSGYSLEKLA